MMCSFAPFVSVLCILSHDILMGQSLLCGIIVHILMCPSPVMTHGTYCGPGGGGLVSHVLSDHHHALLFW